MMRLWQRPRAIRSLRLGLFVVGLLALPVGLLSAAASPAPLLTLTPERAACADQVSFAGRDFPPGQAVRFGVRRTQPFSDQIIEFANTTVATDGALVLTLPVAQMVTDCATASPPAAGTRYVINVTPAGKNPQSLLFAQVPFTLVGASDPTTPWIALSPASGPCGTRVAVYGGGFTPDVTARFVLTRERDGAVTAANSSGGGQLVAGNGTVTLVFPITGCGPDEPIGSTFTVAIFESRPDGNPPRGPVASGTFTVVAPTMPTKMPNTGGGGAAEAR